MMWRMLMPLALSCACSGNALPVDESERRLPEAVAVDGFEIDRTRVTVARYRECVEAEACVADGLDFHRACHWSRDGYDGLPINCLDWFQAAAFCAWAGKRLPTDAEWARASAEGIVDLEAGIAEWVADEADAPRGMHVALGGQPAQGAAPPLRRRGEPSPAIGFRCAGPISKAHDALAVLADRPKPTRRTVAARTTVLKANLFVAQGRLAYVRNRNMRDFELVIVDLAGRHETVIDWKQTFGGISFAAGGRRLLFHGKSPDRARYLASLAWDSGSTEAEATLLVESESAVLFPVLRPDGEQLAFHMSRGGLRVVLADARGTGAHLLPCREGDCSLPAWSPDGERIIYVVDSDRLVQLDMKSRATSTLHRVKEGDKITRPSLSPDGKRVLYTVLRGIGPYSTRASSSRIEILTLGKATPKIVLENKHSISSACWIGDAAIGYAEAKGGAGRFRLSMREIETDREAQISADRYFAYGCAWTP